MGGGDLGDGVRAGFGALAGGEHYALDLGADGFGFLVDFIAVVGEVFFEDVFEPAGEVFNVAGGVRKGVQEDGLDELLEAVCGEGDAAALEPDGGGDDYPGVKARPIFGKGDGMTGVKLALKEFHQAGDKFSGRPLFQDGAF